MKNSSIRVIVTCAFLPMIAFAQTVTDTVPDQVDCAVITHNLKLGSKDLNTDGDVTLLQTYLSQANYLESDPTGYFGKATKKAVQEFQSANGITPLGSVGPYTRMKIKDLSCQTTKTQPVTAVTEGTTVSGGKVYIEPVAIKQYTKTPTCTISSDKTSYSVGDKITFSYQSEGATYATWVKDASGKDNLYVPGDKLTTSGVYTTTATVTGNPSVTLGVYGPGGSSTCTKVVSVLSSSLPIPKMTYFTTSNTTIQRGVGVTVKWVAENAVNCNLAHTSNTSSVADGLSIGTASEYTVYPTESTQYTLSCFGSGVSGKDTPSAIKQFNVTVNQAPLPTCQVTQQTTSVATNPFTISWTSTNASYGVAPSGDKIGTNGSSVYQLSQGEEKKYDFTFFNVDGKSTTCSTFFSSVKG